MIRVNKIIYSYISVHRLEVEKTTSGDTLHSIQKHEFVMDGIHFVQ